ncbi:hypothetical protein E4634_01915 [Mangrovimicrobium sediminis]|uniref:Glycosyltransferase family 2 protein n=1 Tax=Mangrovimicrobium sediminis TaxID=2562682 RepID=A0A4Z0M8F8_9GAMM|nr:hypothetical protein [Haliea sp. SAOS-164]TGD75667.1 hypothetical protein E4634_01915 [Haliea sp. SAOS-164]
MYFGPFRKVKKFSEWLKLHTTYGRLDHYNHLALTSKSPGISSEPRERSLTVTLTTYAHRIHSVHLVIESLLQQTVKPDRIILWLAEEEFRDQPVPVILALQQARGLQIEYCEELRSYKKIIPALLRYPDDILVTVDDDVIYPHDHIERLYLAYSRAPETIHCGRAHLITRHSDGTPAPYARWEYEHQQSAESLLVCPTGCGGVIYTAASFDREVTNVEAFTELAPSADDLWLKAMSLRCSTPCRLMDFARPFDHYLKVPDIRGDSLKYANHRSENDRQFRRILEAYPDIRTLIARAD